MDIGIVYAELKHFKYCRILQNHFSFQDALITKLDCSGKESGGFYSNCLYVFEQAPVKPVPNFILIANDTAGFQENFYQDCNYLILAPNQGTRPITGFLKRLFDDDERMSIAILPLIDALLKDKGLQLLSDITGTILGNPFWVIDMNYNFLTKPAGIITNTNILEEVQRGYILDETVMELRRNQTRDIVSRMNEAFCFQVYNENHHMLMAAVKINNTTIAYINAYDENHAFTSYDYRILNKAASIIGNELQKNRYFKNNKGLMYSYLLNDLLENNIPYEADLSQRLRTLGHTPQKYYYVLTVDLGQTETRDIRIDAINEQLKYILPNSIYSIYQDHAVFLFSRDDLLSREHPVTLRLIDYLRASNLHAGLSVPFEDIRQIRRHYDKTLETLRLIKNYYPDILICTYSDYAFTHLLETVSDTVSYSDLCGGALLRLLKQDEEKGTDYLHTLYIWLLHNMQYPAAAKELMIHENTLRYRVEKARKLMEYPLENGKQIMEFMVAYELWKFTSAKKTGN